MAVPALVLSFGDEVFQVSAAGSGSLPVQMVRSLESCEASAQKVFKLPPGTFDLMDRFGKIERPEDLQRALDTAGGGECVIEVREHRHHTMIRGLEKVNVRQDKRMDNIEGLLKGAQERAQKALQVESSALRQYVEKVERQVHEEVLPVIEELCRDRTQLQKDLRKAQDKLRQINLRELHEMRQDFFALKEQVTAAVKRVDRIDVMWTTEKTRIEEDLFRNNAEIKELQRYMQGRIDVCVEADADLARNQQLIENRVKLITDDLALFREDTVELTDLAGHARGKHAELTDVIARMESETASLLTDSKHFKTRLRCLEVEGMEEWPGFMPGTIFYSKWSTSIHGADVQLSKDCLLATGRGNLSATGVLLEDHEGLVVADGPCRRFGRPGFWASYFEVELEELMMVPSGAGGMYVGFALQSAGEMTEHPRQEFDGWLVGGAGIAAVCRLGAAGVEERDAEHIPATFAPGMEASETAFRSVKERAAKLRGAVVHKAKREVRQLEGGWASERLELGDRVGVLFRAKEKGGARLRVAVNDKIVADFDFGEADCPPEEALGHLTPLVKISGTAKSVRVLRDAKPVKRVLDA